MKRQCRYITCGTTIETDKISDFRLISGKNLTPENGDTAIRVQIPNDLKLSKWSCDSYSTTSDERTLKELGCDLVIWYADEKKWKVHNEYKHLQLYEIPISYYFNPEKPYSSFVLN